MLEPIQADRDAAAELFAQTGGTKTACQMMRDGVADESPVIQAFAAYRRRLVAEEMEGTNLYAGLYAARCGRVLELECALRLAFPIIEEEREVWFDSNLNRSGPCKGEVTGEAKEILDRLDAALTVISLALRDSDAAPEEKVSD